MWGEEPRTSAQKILAASTQGRMVDEQSQFHGSRNSGDMKGVGMLESSLGGTEACLFVKLMLRMF